MTKAQTAVIQCNQRTKCSANHPFLDLQLLFSFDITKREQPNHIQFIVRWQ